MTTHQFGQWTIEGKPREWRAWRRFLGTTCQATDQVCVNGQWVSCGEPSGRECNRSMYYRRPVPLPSIDPELVDACFNAEMNTYAIPYGSDGTCRFNRDREKAIGYLRTLLPGYEEQLSKKDSPWRPIETEDDDVWQRSLECFPVGEFIAEEMDARGWSARDLAEEMGGDVEVNTLTIELHIACGESEPDAYLGKETADGLARAFGTSAEVWLNLDAAYRSWRKELPPPPQEKGGEA